MAEKRLHDDHLHCIDPDQQPDHKHMKTTSSSFSSVSNEVVMVSAWEKFFSSAMEPMLRRVVKEEVEAGLRRSSMISLTKSPCYKMQDMESSSSLRLTFNCPLSLPIFAGSKITTIDKSPLQVHLSKGRSPPVVECSTSSTQLPHDHIKIEIVVINGDFPYGEDENTWSNEDFDKSIVKERSGRRPLIITGELVNNITTMKNGVGFVGDVEFTDNSSWIRSRKFRLGARVVSSGNTSNGKSGVSTVIRSAITEAFVVRDHRGELYKKHYPPALEDEVWRLEKIRRDGACHRILSTEGIHTVQDFLKMAAVDSIKLTKILGSAGMSEKTRKTTLKHAWTCKMGNKLYLYKGCNFVLFVNPVCKFVNAVVDGQVIKEDSTFQHSAYIRKLVKDAYENWNSLEEVDAQVNDAVLLTTGDLEGEASTQWLLESAGFGF